MKSSFVISSYSRFNMFESRSDVPVFVDLYRQRINAGLRREEANAKIDFLSFAERKISTVDAMLWVQDNTERFIKDTPNVDNLIYTYYEVDCGYIFCMTYSADGEHILLGFSSGLIQEETDTLENYYSNEPPKTWYPMFYRAALKQESTFDWVTTNHERFLKNTPNEIMYHRWFFSEAGAITVIQYSPNGNHIIVGHSSGLIEMRNGHTGAVLCTLRNIQFPAKPVYALQYSLTEQNVCYAACMDGAVYRIELPYIDSPPVELSSSAIRADPALETLNTQFYGSPGISGYSTPFVTQRTAAMSLGLLAELPRMAVGYEDGSIRVYDMETQEADLTYKVLKSRLQFIPKKLQRMHFGPTVALRAHPTKPNTFVSGSWDKTLRVWDVRCKVGCVMTFEGVDICHDSIDIIREQCITGSWQTTEALAVWDLTAKKKLHIIRVQNRRPDVDGEYIYACRYWHSTDYNRKGKYAIIGGSGTKCVEVINLHNRYISCSYPALGTILAVASHQERIAFGGTYPAFCTVTFHDPKHEKALYEPVITPDYDYTKPVLLDSTSTDIQFYSDFDSTSPTTNSVSPPPLDENELQNDDEKMIP